MRNCFLLAVNVPIQENEITITLELILAIIAIVVSIISVVVQCFFSQKNNRTNLEADFFKDIYGDYLMKTIPEARQVIHYSNNMVTDTDDLSEVLNDIRQSSLFFKYKDKTYYQLLCNKLQLLEDKLVKKTGYMKDDDYADFILEINKDIEEIYDIIMKKYIGKKVR